MLTREEFQILYDQGPDAVYAFIQSLMSQIVKLSEQASRLSERVTQLEALLAKDSHNSSKPPSTDGFKRTPKSLREKTGRKPGAQPGHPGTTLFLSDKPDEVIVHPPAVCAHCGTSLEAMASVVHERRQVHDLPTLSLHVTEHQTCCTTCPHCQTVNTSSFPEEMGRTVQYGPKIKAFCIYLQAYQLLPFARTQEMLSDVFGCSLSEGTLLNILSACYHSLAPVEAAIKTAIEKAPVGHFDETGIRIANKLNWQHTASTRTLTYLACHAKRGQEALEAIGILPVFSGTAVHDAYASYSAYKCSHALCNVHLLRELTFFKEQGEMKGQIPQSWAEKIIALLLCIKKAVEEARSQGQTHLSAETMSAFDAQYTALISEGLRINPARAPAGKRGRAKQSPAFNLLKRLDGQKKAVLAFMTDFQVPFDNNQAERDLRMSKVRQKISGCFRSTEGAQVFCRIRGYLSTLRKQGIGLLDALERLFQNNPVMPQLTAV